jgi:ABC-2 type transport system permease protein
MTRSLRHTYLLTLRALRESPRQPAIEISSLFIPLFFLAVITGSIGSVAGAAFGVDNFTGFLMPTAMLQAAAGAGGNSSAGMVQDIQSGYFDKLLLTPSSRLALIFGRLLADAVRGMGLAAAILTVGLIAGAGIAAGPLGFVALVLGTGLFSLAYSGIGMALALKTGSPQADKVGFLVLFPLLFLSPALAPKDVFSGWLQFLATINPITYIIQSMRDLVLEGWDPVSIALGLAAILGLATFSWSLSLVALRSRAV